MRSVVMSDSVCSSRPASLWMADQGTPSTRLKQVLAEHVAAEHGGRRLRPWRGQLNVLALVNEQPAVAHHALDRDADGRR